MFTPTQLQNDPLLTGDDEIIADLGRTMRWAALGYGFVGVIAAWFVAAAIGLGRAIATPYGWAAGLTLVIIVVTVWYFTTVDRIYRSTQAYTDSRTQRRLAALDKEAVVGLRGELGKWIGGAIGALVVVTFVAAVVVTASRPISLAWPWFFVGISLLLAYAYGFFALHMHLIERARDAAASASALAE
ncbi:hypothetical protein [Rathayibacter soli]|uniref:hypothetical protein n=1 Tax=Rathayibacter soli TaxID=3144168 RepID=UPI0027E488CF|nr:hypothetical protein [Glaciibacter superstes]